MFNSLDDMWYIGIIGNGIMKTSLLRDFADKAIY